LLVSLFLLSETVSSLYLCHPIHSKERYDDDFAAPLVTDEWSDQFTANPLSTLGAFDDPSPSLGFLDQTASLLQGMGQDGSGSQEGDTASVMARLFQELNIKSKIHRRITMEVLINSCSELLSRFGDSTAPELYQQILTAFKCDKKYEPRREHTH